MTRNNQTTFESETLSAEVEVEFAEMAVEAIRMMNSEEARSLMASFDEEEGRVKVEGQVVLPSWWDLPELDSQLWEVTEEEARERWADPSFCLKLAPPAEPVVDSRYWSRLEWLHNREEAGWELLELREEAQRLAKEAQASCSLKYGETKEVTQPLADRAQALFEKRSSLFEALDRAKPECPKCGSHMEPRRGPKGSFWGCPGYPSCYGTRQMPGAVAAQMDRFFQAIKAIKPVIDGLWEEVRGIWTEAKAEMQGMWIPCKETWAEVQKFGQENPSAWGFVNEEDQSLGLARYWAEWDPMSSIKEDGDVQTWGNKPNVWDILRDAHVEEMRLMNSRIEEDVLDGGDREDEEASVQAAEIEELVKGLDDLAGLLAA